MTVRTTRTLKKAAAFSTIAMCSFSISLALLGTCHARNAVYADAMPSASLQQATDNILNQYVTSGNFSGEVLLEKHGQILVDKAYGYANIEQKRAATKDTRFAIGALTQGFTAVAIMQLQDRGLLHVTDPVGKFIPGYSSDGQQITIHELLTHTSGAPGSGTQTIKPGTAFQYSILNYLLLGQIIEQVSGELYSSYIQQHILTPLGMNHTGFIHKMSDVQDSATGYVPANNTLMPIQLDASNYTSSDGMYSTAEDLYKWDQALYTGKLVTMQDLVQMFTPDPVTEKTLQTYGYGYGWQVSLDGGVVSNESAFGGFHSLIARVLKDDVTVILLSNEDSSPLDEITGRLGPLLVQTSIPAGDAASTVAGQKKIIVNNKALSNPFSRIAFGTTYMPIWYIGQAMQSLGIQESWVGANRVWNINLPSTVKVDLSGIDLGQGNTDIFVNGQLVKRINTYAWIDPASGYKSYTVYAPIFYIQQLLSAAGVKTNWDGHTLSAFAQFPQG
jgi:CubicO group peptidase (beta-lactamase class C family)